MDWGLSRRPGGSPHSQNTRDPGCSCPLLRAVAKEGRIHPERRDRATRGAVQALDEFVDSGVLKLDDFDKDQIEGGKVDGKLYGISLGANSVAAIYSQTAFDAVGGTAPKLGWSYEDVPELAEPFLSKGNGLKLLADGSSAEPALDNWIRGVDLIGARFNTVVGLIFLAIVLISPGGLMGIWESLTDRLRRRFAYEPHAATEPPPVP